MGGAEIVTRNVLCRLPRDRYDIRLYFLHDAGPVGRELVTAGFESVERLCGWRRDPVAVLRLARQFQTFHPGAIWCLDHVDAMWVGRGAAALAGVPTTVIASHSTGLIGRDGRERPSFGARERVLLEFVTRLVAVSRTHAQYLASITGFAGDRIDVIENGIELALWPPVTPQSRRDARAALGVGNEERVLVMVAALRPEKAHEIMLDAVAAMERTGRRLRVFLAGDGPRREMLRQRAQQLGIADRVEFLGVRRDVARLLHAGDVVVLPSRGVVETLPLSVLEAMASGIPVIASRAGSVPDIVIDGETGLLISPGSASELARAIGATLDDPVAAVRRAQFARRRVETYYSVDRTTAGYRRLFDELVAA